MRLVYNMSSTYSIVLKFNSKRKWWAVYSYGALPVHDGWHDINTPLEYMHFWRSSIYTHELCPINVNKQLYWKTSTCNSFDCAITFRWFYYAPIVKAIHMEKVSELTQRIYVLLVFFFLFIPGCMGHCT